MGRFLHSLEFVSKNELHPILCCEAALSYWGVSTFVGIMCYMPGYPKGKVMDAYIYAMGIDTTENLECVEVFPNMFVETPEQAMISMLVLDRPNQFLHEAIDVMYNYMFDSNPMDKDKFERMACEQGVWEQVLCIRKEIADDPEYL